jgi:hypothetical protein
MKLKAIFAALSFVYAINAFATDLCVNAVSADSRLPQIFWRELTAIQNDAPGLSDYVESGGYQTKIVNSASTEFITMYRGVRVKNIADLDLQFNYRRDEAGLPTKYGGDYFAPGKMSAMNFAQTEGLVLTYVIPACLLTAKAGGYYGKADLETLKKFGLNTSAYFLKKIERVPIYCGFTSPENPLEPLPQSEVEALKSRVIESAK